MRDYEAECKARVAFIQELLKKSGAAGIVYGNSGGKDSALVGILCKMACNNTRGIIMPCGSKQNYTSDKEDALAVARQFSIETEILDLTRQKELAVEGLSELTTLHTAALANIAPRLRMMSLYAVAAAENRMVAGTGNASEYYMGYFTKWGDGACDFNPICDLTVTEIYQFLAYLKAPRNILEKAPSAGLFEGQTDEKEMGVSYRAIDNFLRTGQATPEEAAIIARYHNGSRHKREGIAVYGETLLPPKGN